MLVDLISLGIAYAIIEPHSFWGFIGTILFSFVIQIFLTVFLELLFGRRRKY